jgi:RNA polymerase sigma-70 factor (ECF subfamily)
MDPSDEELVARARGGDGAAADVLFGRYPDLLRGLARRALGDRLRPKVAESDVVQDARLVAFRSLARFEDRGPGSFRRWLAGILERRASEERRRFRAARRAVRRESPSAPRADLVAASQPTPSLVAIAHERRLAVLRAIDGLPQAYRSVIRLVDLSGLSFVEAAERMERTPDAVRKLYARAVASLTVVLARGGAGFP